MSKQGQKWEAEQREADRNLSIPIRTSGTSGEGFGSSDDCPRKGSVLLESWSQRRVIVNTSCKMWRCKSCRDRNMAGFKMKVSTGVSRLGRCAFITITYKADGKWADTAESVSRDWRALRRRLLLNAPWVSELRFLRVMELTKKGTPHHHLVMGPVPLDKKIRCWRRNDKLDGGWYLSRLDSCLCMAHTISREWYAVTGDSFMVHGIPVTGAAGAGGYMAKYMGKEFDGERAEVLGMQRRWSTSHKWPGTGRVRLKQSGRPEGWRRKSFRYGQVGSDIEGGPADLLERQGDSLDKALARKRSAGRIVKQIKGGSNAAA